MAVNPAPVEEQTAVGRLRKAIECDLPTTYARTVSPSSCGRSPIWMSFRWVCRFSQIGQSMTLSMPIWIGGFELSRGPSGVDFGCINSIRYINWGYGPGTIESDG